MSGALWPCPPLVSAAGAGFLISMGFDMLQRGWDADADAGVLERWVPSLRGSCALLYACTAKVVLGALDRDVGCAPTQVQVLGNGRWPCTHFLRERCQNGACFSGCIWTGKEG
jgi:hypothetical protein